VNRAQEALFELIGADEVVNRLEEQNGELLERQDALENENRLLTRQIEDLDYLNLYDVRNITEIIPGDQRKKVLNRLRRLRHENPLAKQAVQLTKRFTLGKGIQWTIDQKEVSKVFHEFWTDSENQAVLTTHEAMKELLDEVITDGEKFLTAFSSSVSPYVKLSEIPLEEIQTIIYDPQNRKIPVWYKRTYTTQKYDGKTDQYLPAIEPKTEYYLDHRITADKLKEIKGISIPPSKIAKTKSVDGEDSDYVRIIHIYINPIEGKSGKRGVSELYSSREWLKVFKEFMEHRAAINAAATSIALKRKIKGGPTEVANFSGKLGQLGEVGYDQESEIRKLTRPVAAATYDYNPAVDLDWMKTDTGAAQAKEDARLLLMVAGAGMAVNIHYFGEGGDANLATAQAMELPMVKAYEDWQTWFKSVLYTVARFVFLQAFPDGLPEQTPNTEAVNDSPDNGEDDQVERPNTPEAILAWSFPPIISKDIVKVMTGYATLVSQVAKDSVTAQKAAVRGAMGALEIPNLEQIMPKVDHELEKVAEDKEEMKEITAANLAAGPQNGASQNGNGKGEKLPPGAGGAGFQNAQKTGLDAGTRRVAVGRPPLRRGKDARD
jgi:hypothetical protein